MALILDGRVVRDQIQKKLLGVVSGLPSVPVLVIIQIGDREDSNAYVNQKKKFADVVKVSIDHRKFSESVSKEEVVRLIRELNQNKGIHGIIIQLPVPSKFDPQEFIEEIAPEKDVDGLTSFNLKLLWTNTSGGFVPATPQGILTLLDYYKIPLAGKKITIVGRSVLVGKPAILAMLNRDATVTACHSGTCNLEDETRNADIVIVATGKPKLIGKEHVLPGQTIIDVGINLVGGQNFEEEVEGYTFVGDVDFEEVKDIVGAISPVPGGVGPMTVASLFENLLKAYEQQNK
ncbi:MAG: hypothetical protein RJA61_343 [Candidatus Parcubacteria bacterium]|jgi:methylenetetrahydrofolate dehydrogenase (NADP+)/methenyltetrahydrofolate cyclohydrolase